ncbi:MAG TPA: YtxH domain-containing protein [Candidatus Dojkabacteria bacterium]|nr:YtxH domain-containing protein [Candidatus Dojkabacteria bacterium]HRO64677.1 YtxH domain-containing protein [Candidatus Dojkabacteria bacterium]HRP36541.1 YtxH domain-containing protein [Candidatus Dojkabacteria bacterium]HRP51023.1 YtxH domain-containing protein [Candidatus Dojkabacteria bacterium]
MSEYSKRKAQSSGGLLGGIVLGGLIGATLGVLFAPKKGEDTRKQIKKTGEKYYKTGKVKVEELKKKEIDPRLKTLEKEAKKRVSDVERSVKKVVADKTPSKK